MINKVSRWKSNNYAQGLLGEKVALSFLENLGYKLIEKRFKTKKGEVDLVMRDGDTIVFIEVKKRISMFDSLTALAKKQMKRIIRAAHLFLQNAELLNKCNFRFDLVGLSNFGEVNHIKNITMDMGIDANEYPPEECFCF